MASSGVDGALPSPTVSVQGGEIELILGPMFSGKVVSQLQRLRLLLCYRQDHIDMRCCTDDGAAAADPEAQGSRPAMLPGVLSGVLVKAFRQPFSAGVAKEEEGACT